ncbi:MAG TPA: Hsp20/alpha crystallin family protein [Candidatus Binatia bacterium]|nr:Hsp20/alpha crystallin family protein [Candidatus Binatia bacterium]
MAERTIATRSQKSINPDREETRSQEQYITPPVDIYETQDGLVVKADLPGVSKDSMDVRVENNLLTIRANAAHIAPGDIVYREYALVNFFRQFELNERVDQSKIAAELNHGVLTLKLPKAEETKPRKIDVKVV